MSSWSNTAEELPEGAVSGFVAAHCWEDNAGPDSTPNASPERRLLTAVLARAIQDRDMGQSFETLCELLDLDASTLRRGAAVRRRRLTVLNL